MRLVVIVDFEEVFFLFKDFKILEKMFLRDLRNFTFNFDFFFWYWIKFYKFENMWLEI